MRITVIVATLGRPREADDLVNDLVNQTRRPDRTVFAVVKPEDAPGRNPDIANETLLCPRKGLCAQRNAALDHVADSSDVIVFFDDDFVPHRTFLERVEHAFEANSEYVGVTGAVVADGICGPGLTRQEAVDAVEAHGARQVDGPPGETDVPGLYGCNMAMRVDALGGRRFDERLPLYGWLEDLDFTNRLLDEGRLVRLDSLIGAHRGVKAARVSGLRLGYSQIANARYLMAKGSAPRWLMMKNLVKYPVVNATRALLPEPYIDRWGRLRGNVIGLFDLARGRSRPERILDL